MKASNKSNILLNHTIKALLDNTRDFMFVKDKDFVYVGASQAFARDVAGHDHVDDIINHTDFEIFEDKELAAKYRRDDEELFASRKPMVEYRESYPDRDGKKRYCLTTKYVIQDEDGNPIGLYGQGHDITDQVETEENERSFRKTLERQNKVFAAMRDVYDIILFYNFENDVYYHMTGDKTAKDYVKESGVLSEMIPEWMERNMTAEAREACRLFFDLTTMSDRLTKHGVLTREVEVINFGWVRVSLIPVDYNNRGKVISCLWVGESIDEEKQRELEHRKALEAAKHAAETDSLTNLMNRGSSEYVLRSMSEENHTGMLCLFDIDHFKRINDKYGHAAGDRVLIKIADAMRKIFRKDDVLARFGGDEFVVFAKGINSIDSAHKCLQRLVAAVEEEHIDIIDGEKVSISVGAVFIDGSKKYEFDDAYLKCDNSMYFCKAEEGRSYRLTAV